MQKLFTRRFSILALLAVCITPAIAQDSTTTNMSMTTTTTSTDMTTSSQPRMGTKNFSTFSIGVNAGVLTPTVPIGGSNDFTKWKPSFGYGLYIKNQFTHLLAVEVEAIRGNLQANNDNKLGNGSTTTNPYQSFKTDLNYAVSMSGVVTFGNVNWLSDKNAVIPYVSAGAGVAGYKPVLNNEGNSPITYKSSDIHEFFVPVGGGLKIVASQALNIDLGFRMNFVDADNLDGYNSGMHKDKFSYGFAGLEFAFGSKGKPQLMADNPVVDFKRDLMDQNNALKASLTASEQQSADSVNALRNEINNLKRDADNDGVADYLDKCPNTPDSVKVDGSGCPLPQMAPPPPPPSKTVIITEEDRRTVAEAIKDLQFETGKSTIRSTSYPSLDRVAQILINKNFSLKLAGHTDNVGSDDANMKLSKDRAEAVKDYLVSKGANPSRIEATGYGETQPIASNKTAAGRQKNRRVEFTLF